MSAKYDMLEHSITNNPFGTKYFAWLDIGVYREYPQNGPCFRVGLPPNFTESKIAMSQAYDFIPDRNSSVIIEGNHVWVGGAAAFGEKNSFLVYIDQYRSTAKKMLEIEWISIDQQIIYAMFADRSLNVNLNVQIQSYCVAKWGLPQYSSNPWFYVAYLAREDQSCAQ